MMIICPWLAFFNSSQNWTTTNMWEISFKWSFDTFMDLSNTYRITNIGVHGDQDRVGHKEESPERKLFFILFWSVCSILSFDSPSTCCYLILFHLLHVLSNIALHTLAALSCSRYYMCCLLSCLTLLCILFAALRCHVVQSEDPVVDGRLASEASPHFFEVIIPDVVHCHRTPVAPSCAAGDYLALLINS